ncbi:hypothetical protein HS088_TW02G00743 [Tripterygium wilfordii]|uniref:Uncharacterized protein n=1 Tax=Tripterygium wilfordii TaxID=458696 RepID=A0A7J7E076_TRIWF|nr:hypothetical protein HS088_TW02G00743 [Tripterygium wilfordii]
MWSVGGCMGLYLDMPIMDAVYVMLCDFCMWLKVTGFHCFPSYVGLFFQGRLLISSSISWCSLSLQSWSSVHFSHFHIYSYICYWWIYCSFLPQSVCHNWMGIFLF